MWKISSKNIICSQEILVAVYYMMGAVQLYWFSLNCVNKEICIVFFVVVGGDGRFFVYLMLLDYKIRIEKVCALCILIKSRKKEKHTFFSDFFFFNLQKFCCLLDASVTIG